MSIKLILSLLLLGNSFFAVAQKLVTYEAPGGLKYSAHNDDFTVKVRNPGGEWKDLFEYKVEVDLDTRSVASMVYFDFAGKVEVMIRKNNGWVQNADIRPFSYGIKPTMKGNVILFSLEKPGNISIEINGDRLHNLHLFANEIEKEKPDPDDP